MALSTRLETPRGRPRAYVTSPLTDLPTTQCDSCKAASSKVGGSENSVQNQAFFKSEEETDVKKPLLQAQCSISWDQVTWAFLISEMCF